MYSCESAFVLKFEFNNNYQFSKLIVPWCKRIDVLEKLNTHLALDVLSHACTRRLGQASLKEDETSHAIYIITVKVYI